jgi:VWFA-related protein
MEICALILSEAAAGLRVATKKLDKALPHCLAPRVVTTKARSILDHRRIAHARSDVMSGKVVSRRSLRTHFKLSATVLIVLSAALLPLPRSATRLVRHVIPLALAQGYERELNAAGPASLTIKNRNGRVSVIASNEAKSKMTLQATSPGLPVEPGDIRVNGGMIDVRERRRQDRIDITVSVPPRSRVKIEGDAGMVDIIGDIEFAEVVTNTGTIHADVPLDSLRFNFLWEASRPRFLSDVELPDIKEGHGGRFTISGTLSDNVSTSKKPNVENGETDNTQVVNNQNDGVDNGAKVAENDLNPAAKPGPVRLDLRTQRGVILLNVDPSMVPPDLRERPLTDAARAIIRSGDGPLMDAIRKVSPRMFGDYARTMPPPRSQPALVNLRPPGEVATAVAPELMRVNASVTDRNGRAVGGMNISDFAVYEDGAERKIVNVIPATEPFNLVLLLDVSGSVEERIEFIRKAARDFLNTASPQDRISIISFRNDVQVISEFTTDRSLLWKKLDDIDAGGATALFDSLAYVLTDTLRPLRGERTAIVVLSDGDDNKSFIPFPAVLEALTESGALVYPLYIPSGLIPESSVPRPTVTVDPLRTRYLTITTRAAEEGQKLATYSGGVFYPIKRLEDLQKAYDDVVVQLRTSYTITYASNATSHRRLRVRVSSDGAAVRLSSVVAASR